MDDGIPIGLIVIFALCLGGSFFFSATEMAFSSVSRVRMRARADAGDRRAMRVLSILDQFDNALTALLIGNNIVNIGCATVATIIATNIWGLSAVTIATLVTTVLLFILGETLPKTFAKDESERVTMVTAGILQGLIRVLMPLIRLFNAVATKLAKPFRTVEPAPTVTEEELRDLLDDATRDGGLDEETGALVKSVISYGDATVHDVLTPWRDVQKLPISTPPEEAMESVRTSHHSRLPVTGPTGEVLGLLRARRYLKASLRTGSPASVEDVMEPAMSISVTTPIDELLPRMSAERTHFAVVRDEWENALGIITVEDILERLVGDIWDEDDDAMLPMGGEAR